MPAKSAIRCETPRCIDDIAKYGERYHDVYDAAVYSQSEADVDAQCCRCGGKHLIGGGWRHTCKQCKTTVPPGELVGLFVPHSCAACLQKNRDADRARGAICRRCNKPYTDCCC